MGFIAESRRNAFWFGTEEKMAFLPTPNRGASTSGSGWEAEGTTLNGGGFQLNSFGSHRQYVFEWPVTSSARMSQLMKSFADGTYGRGLIYFLDPLTYGTNILPAMWADPSMGVGQEGATLVYGVEASGLPTSDNPNELPVKSAYYDLGTISTGWRGKEDAVFIPVPEGYTLSFGSIHSQTGQGRVLYRTQSKAGALGAVTAVTPLAVNTSQVVNTLVSGPDLAGVWLFVGKIGAGAGSVTLTAMTGRLLPTVKAVVAPVATNLFTNPRLVGDGTYAEVGRNLFTNPRLVGDGTWAEVLRNLVRNPLAVGTAHYASNNGAGSAMVLESRPNDGPYGRTQMIRGTRTGAGNNWAYVQMSGSGEGDRPTVTPGEWVAVRARVWASLEWVTANIQFRADTVFVSQAASGLLPVTSAGEDGTWVEFYAQVPEGVTHVNFSVGYASGQAGNLAESWVQVATPMAVRAVSQDEALRRVRQFFAPEIGAGFSGVSQPEDFQVSWTGAPNASESIMAGERVAGLILHQRAAGIVSSYGGKPALRLVPLSPYTQASDTWSYVNIPIPVSARSSGTAVGVRHTPTSLEEPTTAGYRSLRASLPNQDASAPNQAGSFPLRLNYQSLTSAYNLSIGHGGAQGSGDVWWTDIGLFAGDYRYPWNGSPDDLSGITQPGDFRTRWTGVENNSELVLEIERVRGLSVFGAAAGVSSRGNKPAVRVIPLTTGNNSFFEIPIPPEARSSGTLLGTIHLESPLTGVLNVNALRLRTIAPDLTSSPAPNQPGAYPIRHPFSVTSANRALFMHGGTQGSGDVWWTDIGLFAGNYDGPAFNGSSGTIMIGSQLATTEWDGATDNSTSTAYSTSTELINIRKGPWMGGQGHSGCRFIGKPTEIKYGPFNGGQVGFAASFREVGSWLYG